VQPKARRAQIRWIVRSSNPGQAANRQRNRGTDRSDSQGKSLLTIHLESRKVEIAGITTHPTEQWMKQMARNVTVEGSGTLRDSRYLLHDRDTKYTASFLATIESVRVKTLRLPARSPNLNAYCERWVRSTKEECLSKLILFGERSLRRAMSEYVVHYHAERNHQGKSNVLLFPQITETRCEKAVECRDRLGGLLRYYHRDAA
jgi:putative transposase